MYSIFPGLITAGGHYAPFPMAPHKQRLPLKGWVIQTLHGNKKGVEIKMGYHSLKIISFGKPDPNILKNLVLIAGKSIGKILLLMYGMAEYRNKLLKRSDCISAQKITYK
jgi:hypothetical protein